MKVPISRVHTKLNIFDLVFEPNFSLETYGEMFNIVTKVYILNEIYSSLVPCNF